MTLFYIQNNVPKQKLGNNRTHSWKEIVMYELRWIKIIILMGVFGGFVGHFVANNIELGLVIGLGIGSLLKSYNQQKYNRQENWFKSVNIVSFNLKYS